MCPLTPHDTTTPKVFLHCHSRVLRFGIIVRVNQIKHDSQVTHPWTTLWHPWILPHKTSRQCGPLKPTLLVHERLMYMSTDGPFSSPQKRGNGRLLYRSSMANGPVYIDSYTPYFWLPRRNLCQLFHPMLFSLTNGAPCMYRALALIFGALCLLAEVWG